MSVIVAKGEQAKKLNRLRDGAKQYSWLHLKEGQSKQVMFLTSHEQFASYFAHYDYKRKINTHACLKAIQEDCPSCKNGITRRLQTIVLFWDIQSEQIWVWDTVKTHMQTIYALIDAYPEYMEMVFKIKRTGKGNNTLYNFHPILKLGCSMPELISERNAVKLPNPEELINVETADFLAVMYFRRFNMR